MHTEAPLVAWLGDDFTGAAAVMEVLSFAGLPAILFLDTPTPDQLARHTGMAGIGIASMARARPPAWMDAHLPALFATLGATGAGLVHYKICSTLDSAPHIGSIGRAMEIGLARFGPAAVPVVTAAPRMRRYQAFGSLFCGTPDGVFRLDRHPVMSVHPVTPMTEADVARHLSQQTNLPFGCIDLEALADPARARALLDDGPKGWTIDMLDASHEATVGALLWERRAQSRFVIGSQGVEYALVAHLRATGALAKAGLVGGIGRTDAMAVVSGSASPITASQIGWARANGFRTIALDTVAACNGSAEAELTAANAAVAALSEGLPPLIHSAEGPQDPRIAAVRALGDPDRCNDAIGRALGRILADVTQRTGIRRAVVSGGDTSGHVCTALGIHALSALAPTIPGASICRAHADGALDGFEIALKGGQMGSADYFGWIRDGAGERS